MKKLFAFLLACMMLLSVTTAFAYEVKTPTNNTPEITHTLTLTEDGVAELPYEITYAFNVTGGPQIIDPLTGDVNSSVVNPTYAVENAPDISSIEYGPEDIFTSRSCTKPLQIDWSSVKIKEPGVYRWTVEKSVTHTSITGNPSNTKDTTYLYVYATDNAGTLVISGVYMTTDGTMKDESKKGNFVDEYPAKTLNLSINKTVSGNYGSKDQYFAMAVTLTAPSGAASKSVIIEGVDTSVPATAYHQEQTNVTSVTLNGGTPVTVNLWLKNDQTAIFKDLVFGTAYSITESANDGYTVTTAVDGDTEDVKKENATVSDGSLEQSTTVAYTNTKEATVPTGIDLQTGAPIMGLLMAAAMMLMLFAGKRKEAAE
ncbi:MAG: hypothetical protein IKB78_08035 [Clostridia bacterium]|nr:hypothetical protein [Clostridia bacterium]